MSNDVLEKVKQLPADKQRVEEFAEYLLNKYGAEKVTDVKALAEKRRQLAGSLKGNIGWQMILMIRRRILKIICNGFAFRYANHYLASTAARQHFL